VKSKLKNQQIKEAGLSLFNKYGIKKVTVEEICKKAQVSKPTFYKLFPNKKSLAQTIITNSMNEYINKYERILSKESSIKNLFSDIFKFKIEASQEFSKDFFIDFQKNVLSQDHFLKKKEELQKRLISRVLEANGNNINVNKHFLIYMIKSNFFNLGMESSFKSLYPDVESMTKDIASFISYGLFGVSSKNKN
jgi:AcrR family transcriptional regulator